MIVQSGQLNVYVLKDRHARSLSCSKICQIFIELATLGPDAATLLLRGTNSQIHDGTVKLRTASATTPLIQ